MASRSFAHSRAAVACALSVALAAGIVAPAKASVSKTADLRQQGDELLARIDETTHSYQDAEAQLQTLSELIAQNEQTVNDILAHLPEQRARTAASVKTLYKFQQNTPGLIDLVFSAESFNDFISTIYYIDSITDRNTAEIAALNDLQDRLVQTQASLKAQRDSMLATQGDAQAALEQALAIREEIAQNADAIAQMDSTDRAQLLAAAEAAQAVIEAAEASGVEIPTSETGTSASVDAPSHESDAQSRQQTASATTDASTQASPTSDATTSSDSSTATTSESATQTAATTTTTETASSTTDASGDTDWASRINAYLEGTSLAGYGEQFAQAAETYGVDPRIAPAIAGVESGWGQVCFRDYNAWGWGSQSWDSWDTAIDSYVSGYSSIYGSTVTLEGAEMYASNDIYDVWYDTVLSEMDSI